MLAGLPVSIDCAVDKFNLINYWDFSNLSNTLSSSSK